MIRSDKFSIYYQWYGIRLRCDVCHARDWGSGDVFDWSSEEDMNLAALVSHSQAHWARIHAVSEEQ